MQCENVQPLTRFKDLAGTKKEENRMPAVNFKALEDALTLAEDILKLKKGEELKLKFKEGTSVFKRLQ